MQLRNVLAVTMIAGAIASPALADTVDMTFVEGGAGQRVRVHTNGVAFNVFAGQMIHDLSHGTGALSGMDGLQTTFCSDLMQSVSYGTLEFHTADVSEVPGSLPMGAAKASAINDLYLFAAGRQFVNDGSSDADDFATAFQLAIWEIMTDFDGSRASLDHRYGDLRVTRTTGTALSYDIRSNLAELFDAIGHQTGSSNLLALMSDEAQDQIIVVPLPAAAAIGAAGLGLVALRRRRAAAAKS